MFLVPTHSPRRVDELSFLARRIPTVETMYIEEKREENKNKKTFLFSLTLRLSLSLPEPTLFSFLLFLFVFILFILLLLLLFWIHGSYYFSRIRFYPEIIYFFSVHFILNELSPSHFLTSEIFIKISYLKSLAIYHPENCTIF